MLPYHAVASGVDVVAMNLPQRGQLLPNSWTDLPLSFHHGSLLQLATDKTVKDRSTEACTASLVAFELPFQSPVVFFLLFISSATGNSFDLITQLDRHHHYLYPSPPTLLHHSAVAAFCRPSHQLSSIHHLGMTFTEAWSQLFGHERTPVTQHPSLGSLYHHGPALGEHHSRQAHLPLMNKDYCYRSEASAFEGEL